MLYVLILDLNISQLLSNERYIGAKMDTAGPSSLENPNWEDELDACSDSDASWGDEDDLDRESIASSLESNDDAFSNDPETVEVELQLGQMFIRIAAWLIQDIVAIRGFYRRIDVSTIIWRHFKMAKNFLGI